MAGGSTKAVIAALVANMGIAVGKFGGALYTGSSAMLAEGVHSVVDSGNQLLLLFGMKRAGRPADARHPFGYSREIYFWSFVVAVLLFTAGGIVAIYEGIHKLSDPHPVENPYVNYAILTVSIVLEAGSFRVALHEFRKVAGDRHWWTAVTEAKDPVLFTVLFEDSAAMLGLIIALIGLIAAQVLHLPVLDGIASIVIGVVLILASLLLARETKGLLVGESAAPEVLEKVRRAIVAEPGVAGVRDIFSVHLGPHAIIVTAAVDFQDDISAGEVERIVARTDAAIRAADPDILHLFLAPLSFAAGPAQGDPREAYDRAAGPGDAVIGWKLDPDQRAELLQQFPPRYASAVADHVTLKSKVAADATLPGAVHAEIVGRADDGAGVEAMVVRLAGATDRPDGSTWHITWSLAEGREARESNDVIAERGWTELDLPMPVKLTPARFR